MSKIYIGTSGWSYPWKGILYPEEMKSREYLSFYAQNFSAVEVNSSFYHMTRASTFEKWYAETPPDFRFAIKMNRAITHIKSLCGVKEELYTQISGIRVLKEKLGIVLIQLPASLRFEKSYEEFFAFLHMTYPDITFAVEARNRSWFTPEVRVMFTKYALSWVIADAGARFSAYETSTSDTMYIRFHGDEKLYSSSYSEEKIARYVAQIASWEKEGKNVWVFFNNTMSGAAVENARTMKRMLTEISKKA